MVEFEIYSFLCNINTFFEYQHFIKILHNNYDTEALFACLWIQSKAFFAMATNANYEI